MAKTTTTRQQIVMNTSSRKNIALMTNTRKSIPMKRTMKRMSSIVTK